MSGLRRTASPSPRYGQPAEELARYSASLDLLIVGAREHGPVGRLIHGSVSQQLARTARCPLLVLTRAGHAIEMDEAARQGGGALAASAIRRRSVPAKRTGSTLGRDGSASSPAISREIAAGPDDRPLCVGRPRSRP